MQFKFDWNKKIYKNICENTTILKSKVPRLDRQNITSISSKTHDLKETNALIETLPCTVIMMLRLIIIFMQVVIVHEYCVNEKYLAQHFKYSVRSILIK